MVNLSRLSTLGLFAYDLKSVAYKPIPGASASASSVSPPPSVAGALPGPALSVQGNGTSSSSGSSGSRIYLPSPAQPRDDSGDADRQESHSQSQAHRPKTKTRSKTVTRTRTRTRSRAKPTGKPSIPAAASPPVPVKIKTLDADNGGGAACSVEPYDAPPVLKQNFPPYDQTSANIYRYRKQRAVNLGSWFVHEKWMTPSLFTCASGSQSAEIDIAYGWTSPSPNQNQNQNRSLAQSVLERHWDTFIQASDFAFLASIGINTVRLPIGYWNLGPQSGFMNATAFEWVAGVYANSWTRVVRAINEAGEHGLGVLVDLHGAPGSQNGEQHSGVGDGNRGFWGDGEEARRYREKTVDMLVWLARELAGVSNVVGIQVLNEPVYDPGLEDFYSKAIDAMRGASPLAKTLPLYLHDGFDLDRFANYVSSRTDFIVQDHHSYFVFTPSDQAEEGSQHTKDVQGAIAQSLLGASAKVNGNLIVGEWSCALTPQSLANDKDAEEVRKEFCEAQMKVYENATAGWAFWSYKKESCDDDPGWCFKTVVGRSLPSSFTFSTGDAQSKSGSGSSTSTYATTGNDDAADLFMPTVANTATKSFIGKKTQPKAQKHRRPREDTGSHTSIFKPNLQHRFEAIYQRNGDSDSSSDSHSTSGGASQPSYSRGYADGLTTAKVFASYNGSKLGFVGQFMKDAIEVAGPGAVPAGTEGQYKDGFVKGLREGEAAAGISGP